ncbi:MAG: DsbA family protein [Solirubrobacteraceae bacterium]
MTDDLRSAPVPPLDLACDHVRGPAAAPLVFFYGDFACPRCALAHRRLQAGAPVRLVFRHFALRSKHRRAVALACAAEAAAQQGRFWELHDLLFEQPGRQEDPDLWAHAGALGLDLERFESGRRSAEVAVRVKNDLRGGMRAGVAQAPTLAVRGVLYPGPPASMDFIFGK